MAVVISNLADARTALRQASATSLAEPLELFSDPALAPVIGPTFFPEIATLLRQEFPKSRFDLIVACGDDAALALSVLEQGGVGVAFAGPTALADKLAEIAAARGVSFSRVEPVES